MLPRPLDRTTLTKIQRLIEGNFAGRDELYVAAESMDDESRKQICRRLAEHLADNAIELRQLVTACGVDPAEPLDVEAIAVGLLDLVKANRGEPGVLRAAAETERNLKEEYDRAIEATPDKEAEAILERQRNQVTFGEQVLRNIKDSPGESQE